MPDPAPERRICSCGKPAGHASICNLKHDTAAGLLDDDVERIPREVEDVFADRRRERFSKRKPMLNAERKIARAELAATTDGLLALHRQALERALRLSTVSGGNVGTSRAGSGHPSKNLAIDHAGAQTMDDDPRWRERWQVIRRSLERVHELLDEAEGHGSRAQVDMDEDDKDRRIFTEGRGYTCEMVVELLGRDVAGSVRTVWRKRKNTQDPGTRERRIAGMAVKTIDGEPVEDVRELAARSNVRRVVIDPRANC